MHFYVKQNGRQQPFNANRINKSIEQATVGLDDPIGKAVQVATETRLILYDGIPTEERDCAATMLLSGWAWQRMSISW